VIDEKRAFVWRSDQTDRLSDSARRHQIATGIYAPIQWQNEILGVICVDSPALDGKFSDEDLQFLVGVGRFAGMALSAQHNHSQLELKEKLLARLLANFSPKLRPAVREYAAQGKLRPGGRKSQVTVLFCDLCGFTRMVAEADATDVAEMLNEYFQRLADIIHSHDGTVDKFVGDGLLAVFGSPDPDPQHHEKAVKAAMALREAISKTNQQRTARGDMTCPIRVGLHCGEAFHGFVGTTDRVEFTIVGDVVNRAFRYCAAAAGDEILISEDLYHAIFKIVTAERTRIQTKEGELTAFRVKELKS
jgi:adenylate cyclase